MQNKILNELTLNGFCITINFYKYINIYIHKP